MTDSTKPLEKENPERKFLHDLSSPLVTALFLCDMMVEEFKKDGVSGEKLDHILQIHLTLGKMKNMIHARREVLINESKSESKPESKPDA